MSEEDRLNLISNIAVFCAFYGHTALEQYQIKGADINAIAFGYAFAGNHDSVRKIIKQGANLDSVINGYQYGGFEREKNYYKQIAKKFSRDTGPCFTNIVYERQRELSNYKLRINIDELSYKNKRNIVVELLKNLIAKYKGNPVSAFKYRLEGERKEFEENSVAANEVKFWNFLAHRDTVNANRVFNSMPREVQDFLLPALHKDMDSAELNLPYI